MPLIDANNQVSCQQPPTTSHTLHCEFYQCWDSSETNKDLIFLPAVGHAGRRSSCSQWSMHGLAFFLELSVRKISRKIENGFGQPNYSNPKQDGVQNSQNFSQTTFNFTGKKIY